jgi:hypothetical protein
VGERKEGKLKKKKSNLNKKREKMGEGKKKINWKIIGRVGRTWERGNNFIDYRH